MSSKTSWTEGPRLGTKVWWYSSEAANMAARNSAVTAHRTFQPCAGARTARNSSALKKKYSNRWAHLRIKKCRKSMVSALARGNSHCRIGRMKLEVCSLENESVEKLKITEAHIATSSQGTTRVIPAA